MPKHEPSFKPLMNFFLIKCEAHLQASTFSSSSNRGKPSIFTISKPITRHLKPNDVPLSCDEYLDAVSNENITSLPTTKMLKFIFIHNTLVKIKSANNLYLLPGRIMAVPGQEVLLFPYALGSGLYNFLEFLQYSFAESGTYIFNTSSSWVVPQRGSNSKLNHKTDSGNLTLQTKLIMFYTNSSQIRGRKIN